MSIHKRCSNCNAQYSVSLRSCKKCEAVSCNYMVRLRDQEGGTVSRSAPLLTVAKKIEAKLKLQILQGDYLPKNKQIKNDKTLQVLFGQYVSGGRLKPRTITDYREAVFFYLSDWLDLPVISITKQMVECRFCLIRDKGFNGGIPTYSQATKTMRILSALMNYARGDELIEANPVEILKLKRIDRSIQKRDNYLRLAEARKLLKATEGDNHPVALAIRLMLYTGLRKNEALGLRWRDIQDVEGLRVITFLDTKNHRPHYLPVTPEIQDILDRSSKQSDYLFPSPQKQNAFVSDVRSKLSCLCQAVGTEFKCHDLRRTFATRAAEVGIDFLMIKRLLNHKSNDITAQYIQWDSKDNLLIALKSLEKIHY